MITFKEALDEMAWKLERYNSKRTGNRLFTFNHSNVDGHEVRIDINGNDKHEFSVNYKVNGDYNRNKISPDSGKKILNHVHRTLSSFIRHMKPKALNFGSPHERNQKLHQALSKRLARRHGGTVNIIRPDHIDTVTHVVKFDEALDEEVALVRTPQ